jgi:pimeloyl-ACP methyl ester carboxylesterase
MSEAEIPLLYENGPLRIRYLEGNGSDLIVSFSGVGTQRNVEPPPEFPGIASADRQNHVLFVSDKSRSWLNGAGMADQILCCIKATAEHVHADRVIAIGNSMGGTMALHLSKLFDFERVIAFTPQYSVLEKEVPEEDRWFFFRKQIRSYPFPRVENLRPETTKYYIFHGDEHRELAHALRFPKAPGISHYIMPKTDHRVAAHLRERGALRPLVQNLINGKPRQFRKQLSDLGGIPIMQFDAPPAMARHPASPAVL